MRLYASLQLPASMLHGINVNVHVYCKMEAKTGGERSSRKVQI